MRVKKHESDYVWACGGGFQSLMLRQSIANLMFEAFVKTREALLAYEEAGIPWNQIMAYIGPENKPENEVLLDLLHERGVMCMIFAAPVYDKLDPPARMEAYREIIRAGVDISLNRIGRLK
ncbi:MAG: hypothetical protein WD824_11170 [Cyclobacteriaceae bacterium]